LNDVNYDNKTIILLNRVDYRKCTAVYNIRSISLCDNIAEVIIFCLVWQLLVVQIKKVWICLLSLLVLLLSFVI